MKKKKKKSKWQAKREKEASENSQFDPKIHQLGREGFGFQMKKDIKELKLNGEIKKAEMLQKKVSQLEEKLHSRPLSKN